MVRGRYYSERSGSFKKPPKASQSTRWSYAADDVLSENATARD